jgi:urease gamma subunit
VMGKLVIDTLRLAKECQSHGISAEAAERVAEIIREMVEEAYDRGMTVEEIKAEFGRIAHELRPGQPASVQGGER